MAETPTLLKTQWLKLHLLGVAGGISWLGSSLTTFAVVLRDKDTVGPIGVSFLFMAMIVPTILMAPISGLLADKFSTRALIPPLLIIMGLSNLTLAFNPAPWYTYFALALTASAGTAVGASFNAMLPTLAAPDDLPRVNGTQQTYASMGTLFAPALGGFLVASTGYFWPFIIDAISFGLLAIAILALRINRPGVVHVDGQKLKAMDGVKLVFADKLMRSIVILVAVLIVALGVINVGEVFLVMDELKATAAQYGLVGTAFALGSIAGAVTASAIKLPERFHAPVLLAAIGVLALTVVGLGFAWHWYVALAFSFIAGLGNSGLNAYAVGIIMKRSTEEARGRVMAAIGAVISSGSVASLGIAGFAIGIFGVREVLIAGGVGSVAVLLILGPAVWRAAKTDAKTS